MKTIPVSRKRPARYAHVTIVSPLDTLNAWRIQLWSALTT